MQQRVIMHLDMNAFFASVEQQSNPHLRGKPIAVIGAAKRTVITTCSYEARAFGVKTGMNTWQAKQKCPDIVLVVGNNRKYTHTSTRIIKIIREYTPLVEVFSIDEAFLDVSGSLSLFGSAERIAYLIKARIKQQMGITCSIGIAPNKLLAKLASDMQKPDGLTIIYPDDVSRLLERVPIKDLCGIGSKMNQHLGKFGIQTCGDLGRLPVAILRKRFGIIGERLHQMGLGIDDSPVVPIEEAGEVKSVGHSMTLEQDICLRRDILRYLLQLSEMVGRRARRYGVAGKTVHLTVRYADFSTIGRQQTRKEHTNLSEDIFREAVSIRPADGFYRYSLGVALLKNGQYNEAMKQVEAIYALDPGNQEAQQLETKLLSVQSTLGGAGTVSEQRTAEQESRKLEKERREEEAAANRSVQPGLFHDARGDHKLGHGKLLIRIGQAVRKVWEIALADVAQDLRAGRQIAQRSLQPVKPKGHSIAAGLRHLLAVGVQVLYGCQPGQDKQGCQGAKG